MDCVRTALRQGAVSVTCLYRRDRANMPGSQREVANAEDEGIDFQWLSAPEAFVGDGRVTGVRCHRMRLGVPDATGRQAPQVIEDSSRSEEHTSELQSLMRISYAVFCLKKKNNH